MGFVSRIAYPMVAFISLSTQSYSQMNLLGVGNYSCSEFVAKYDDPIYRMGVLGWVGGYVSGINMVLVARDKRYREVASLNADLLLGTVRQYCIKNPNQPIVAGADHFLSTLSLRPWKP